MLVTPSFYLQICLHKHYFHFYFKQCHNIHITNLANLFTNNHTMAKSSTRKASKTSGNKSVASPVAGKNAMPNSPTASIASTASISSMVSL